MPQNNKSIFPMLDIISTTNVGCKNNCGWCGESNSAFKRIYNCKTSPVFKSGMGINKEFMSLKDIKDIKKYNFYSCGNYNQSKDKLLKFIDKLLNYNFKSVNYEQYSLPDKHILKRMVKANTRTVITISPESHDMDISS